MTHLVIGTLILLASIPAWIITWLIGGFFPEYQGWIFFGALGFSFSSLCDAMSGNLLQTKKNK